MIPGEGRLIRAAIDAYMRNVAVVMTRSQERPSQQSAPHFAKESALITVVLGVIMAMAAGCTGYDNGVTGQTSPPTPVRTVSSPLPSGAVPTVTLLIADASGYVRELNPAGTLSSIDVGSTGAVMPCDIAIGSDGSVYIANSLGSAGRVSSDGTYSVVAGNGDIFGTPLPGVATKSPMHPTGIALDSSGTLYITDGLGYVEKVTSDGVLSLVAGNGRQTADPTPGPASASAIAPTGIVIDDAGNLYVTDRNGFVERVSPDGVLSIVAGNGDTAGKPVPGAATASPMLPAGIALDQAGNLYIADRNGYVERVSPSGVLSVIAGNGKSEASDNPTPGPATASPMAPLRVAVDEYGNVYIADQLGYIEMVSADGVLSIVVGNARPNLTFPVTWPTTELPMMVQSVAIGPKKLQ